MKIILSKFAGIGDTLLTTPAIRAIRHSFPESQIIYLTNPYGGLALKNNPNINEITIMDKDPWRTVIGPFKLPIRRYHIEYKDIYKHLNTIPYTDVLIDWNNSYSGYCTIKHIIAKTRIGLPLMGRRAYTQKFYDYNISIPPLCYQGTRFLKTLLPIGISDNNLTTEYHGISEAIKIKMKEWLQKKNYPEKFLLLGVTGSQVYKQWPAEKFIALINELSMRNDIPMLLLSGFSIEEKTTSGIISQSTGIPIVDHELDFEGKAAIISLASLFVTLDTGWKHIAVALKTPTLTIFGSVPMEEWHPLHDPSHIAISHFDSKKDIHLLKTPDFIRNIGHQEILSAILKMWNKII